MHSQVEPAPSLYQIQIEVVVTVRHRSKRNYGFTVCLNFGKSYGLRPMVVAESDSVFARHQREGTPPLGKWSIQRPDVGHRSLIGESVEDQGPGLRRAQNGFEIDAHRLLYGKRARTGDNRVGVPARSGSHDSGQSQRQLKSFRREQVPLMSPAPIEPGIENDQAPHDKPRAAVKQEGRERKRKF